MKRLILLYVLNVVAIFLTTLVIPGISYHGGIGSLLFIAAVFTFISVFIKPIIKLLALPVELLTLGLFSIVTNALLLYVTSFYTPQLVIEGFQFAGFSYTFFTLDPFYIPVWGTAVAGSLVISSLVTLLRWLTM